jgi:transglutaminase-like putative cysteine protease
VRFWVPEGASSGNIYLQAGDAYSNPVFIEIGEGPGVLETGEAVQWSLRQDITVRDIGSFPGNSLYLHIPYPQPGPGQDRASVITPPGDDSVYRLRSEGNLDIFRIDELNPGDTAGISRQIVVTTRAVNAAVSPDRLRPFDTDNPDIAAALAADQWIRPDLVSRTASRITGNAGDVWTRSRLIYDYVRSLLTWDANPPSRVIPDYITTARADSEGYSFLFTSLARSAGVPSRPVGGILVTDDGQSRAWWWAEVWIQGLGWIPVDPALGDGALEFREVTDKAPDYYFGGLEGRHIAFSRGILAAGPLQPDPKLQIPEHIYTLQGAWEEVSGNLESYKSLWFPPRVTAAYPQE